MRNDRLQWMLETYVRGTAEGSVVFMATVPIAEIATQLRIFLLCENRKVYLNTRSLKHLYDKKPAEEFDFILDNLESIVRTPDLLFRNKKDKRGDFCLVKDIQERRYLVSVEIKHFGWEANLQIVTAFRVRGGSYLKGYELLWSRRDGEIHSSPRHHIDGQHDTAPQ